MIAGTGGQSRMRLIPDLAAIVMAFVLSVACTAIVRWFSRRWGIVARPKADRWHTRPTALMGLSLIHI